MILMVQEEIMDWYKKMNAASQKSWIDEKDEDYDFEADGEYYKDGFKAGAVWERERNQAKGHKKPNEIILWDGSAECIPEDYDDHGGGAFAVRVDCAAIYDAKNVRRLIRWLEKAANWMENKEKYRRVSR